jgi:ATP-dependent helicase HrpB
VEDSDVVEQVEAFEEAEAHGFSAGVLRRLELDPRWCTPSSRAATSWPAPCACRALPDAPLDAERAAIARAVLVGFPDRVGKRRDAGRPAVVFAGGGSGELAPESVVREAEFMVCVDARRQQQRTVIERASAIDAEDLLDAFPRARRELRGDALRRAARAGGADQRAALRRPGHRPERAAGRVRGRGGRHVGARGARGGPAALREHGRAPRRSTHRVAFARAHGVATPAIDDARIIEALRVLCEGRRSFADLKALALLPTLLGMLDQATRRALDTVAPETVSLPGPRARARELRGRARRRGSSPACRTSSA